MSYREEIKQRLSSVAPEYCVAFAARAALRSLPLLAAGEKKDIPFWYWNEESRSEKLLSVLQALRISFVCSGQTNSKRQLLSAAYVAHAAADAADAAVHATATTYPETNSQIDEDLRCLDDGMELMVFLQQPLWTQDVPKKWESYESRFYRWAKALNTGFDVWVDWYQDRLEGKMLDWELLLRQVDLPAEINDQGVIAVNEYLATLTEAKQEKKKLEPINLVRGIFIGSGAAGKTSLIRALNGQAVIEGQESMTPGIKIREWPVGTTGITAHFWDFGGQVIAHSTHQFFLRERCLYVLVLDARTEFNANEQAEYWLQHVKAFGKNAPVMLVGNKSDLAPVNLNMGTLREKYPNIIDFYALSCTQATGSHAARFASFKEDLIDNLQKVGTHQVYFTEGQFSVLEELRERSPKNTFLPHQEFEAICSERQINTEGPQNQSWLLDLFDKLGVVIYFPQLARLDSYLLNPRWLTYGIYTLLYSDEAQKGKGVLSENQVIGILGAKRVEDEAGHVLDYPADKCGFVIDAMEEFKLCYRLTSDHKQFVIPDLLPSDQPEFFSFDKNQQGTLAFEFAFRGFLPRHVMPTFIVSRYDEIKSNSVWQQGVLLHNPHYQCDALVQVDYHARTLSLWVQGEQISRYFTVLRDEITDILKRMSELQYQEWVWLNDAMRSDGEQAMLGVNDKRERANFLQLLKMEQANQTVLITESGASYDVGKILQIMPQTFRQNLAGKSSDGEALDSSLILKVFVSYAHEDEKFKDELVKTLKVIQREYPQLEWWDDRQMISGKWEAQIIKEMEQADMTLLLISRDFMASDYCFNKEMQKALLKYKQHGNPLIPIIIRHTDGWRRHEIGKLQALPKDAKPFDEWESPDRFWGDVQKGLSREIEQLLVKKGS